MSINKIAILVCLLGVVSFPVFAQAKLVGQEGNVYKIGEADIAELIMAKAKNFDLEDYKIKNQRQIADRVKFFRPADSVIDLPPSPMSAAYRIDLTYTLPYDIRDGKGEIVYPRGYSFNPLEYMAKQGISLRTPLVIINAEREEEMLWVQKKIARTNKGTFKLLITNGYAYPLSEKFGFPVYYLSEHMKERFAVRVTPTVVFQPNKERKYLTANVFKLDSEGREIIPRGKR